jgi:predicted transglutaminase-like cysteine proteinase
MPVRGRYQARASNLAVARGMRVASIGRVTALSIADHPHREMTSPRLPHRSKQLSHRSLRISASQSAQGLSDNFGVENGYSIAGRSISPWLVASAGCFALVLFAAFGNAPSLFANGVSPTMPGVAAIASNDLSDRGRANERMALVTPARPIIPPPTFNEPFGFETVPIVSGRLFNTWRGLQDDIRAESLVLARCRMNAERCSPAVQRFLAIIAEGRAHTGRARIGVINRAINMTIRPKRDADHWKPPLDTLSSGTGDCKNYAIAKYVALIEAGIAEKDVKVVIVRDLAIGQNHAIVATRLGPNWIMLDNRWLTLLQDAEMRRVVPLFVLDHNGLRNFVHENTNGDPVVLRGARNVRSKRAKNSAEAGLEQGLEESMAGSDPVSATQRRATNPNTKSESEDD